MPQRVNVFSDGQTATCPKWRAWWSDTKNRCIQELLNDLSLDDALGDLRPSPHVRLCYFWWLSKSSGGYDFLFSMPARQWQNLQSSLAQHYPCHSWNNGSASQFTRQSSGTRLVCIGSLVKGTEPVRFALINIMGYFFIKIISKIPQMQVRARGRLGRLGRPRAGKNTP